MGLPNLDDAASNVTRSARCRPGFSPRPQVNRGQLVTRNPRVPIQTFFCSRLMKTDTISHCFTRQCKFLGMHRKEFCRQPINQLKVSMRSEVINEVQRLEQKVASHLTWMSPTQVINCLLVFYEHNFCPGSKRSNEHSLSNQTIKFHLRNV